MRLQNEITFIGFIGRTCICLCCFPLSFCKDFSGSPTIIFYSQFFFAILFYASQFWWDDLSRSQYRWDCHVMSCHVSSPSPLLLLFPRCPSCCSVLLASTGGGSIHFTLFLVSPFFAIRPVCRIHPYTTFISPLFLSEHLHKRQPSHVIFSSVQKRWTSGRFWRSYDDRQMTTDWRSVPQCLPLTSHTTRCINPTSNGIKTLQELRMLSCVNLNCQVTTIVRNSGSHLSEM